MPRGTQLQPLELAPEWLTNSPVTADDFRCLTPASTIFRMSFGARSHSNPRESVVSMESDDAESDGSTFLWGDESESEDDADTIEEPEPTPVARPEPSPQPQSLPTPVHSRAPSTESVGKRQDRAVDFRLPWFMQVDPVCLTSLDDQLLQSPLDAFADLCYAQAVRASDIPTGEAQAGHSYGYSWRRLSRLLSACPDVTQAALGLESNQGSDPERERESESDSDTDSEQLASPEQHAPAPSWGLSVYQPKSEREQSESPYRPYTSQTLIAKPLPALPTYEPVPEPPRTPPSCSPPPLRPSDAVAQAQLAFLFAGSPPRAGESVHFFPTKEQQGPPPKRGRSRRGTLRISTDDGGSGGGGGGTAPWSPRLGIFQRGLAGLRAGLSH
ncbi:hypothetical protein TRAPUB_1225 [Trametes pubescens]|uniref:Uncharacterized protein n=1 Tax=Trametes pubescens TaxID=154538 RepID=A0A1M2VJU6_TRAPU|nr:hypothetical protein TRAPUB_1225 [Trametes pubescens]